MAEKTITIPISEYFELRRNKRQKMSNHLEDDEPIEAYKEVLGTMLNFASREQVSRLQELTGYRIHLVSNTITGLKTSRLKRFAPEIQGK